MLLFVKYLLLKRYISHLKEVAFIVDTVVSGIALGAQVLEMRAGLLHLVKDVAILRAERRAQLVFEK